MRIFLLMLAAVLVGWVIIEMIGRRNESHSNLRRVAGGVVKVLGLMVILAVLIFVGLMAWGELHR
jgi:choline-glycine betaine transporter